MIQKAIIFLTLFNLLGCGKIGPCPGEVDIPFWVDPIKEEYRVGDTITFFSKVPATINDPRGFRIEFSSLSGRLGFGLAPLDSSFYEKSSRTSEYLDVLNVDQFGLFHIYSQVSDDYSGNYVCGDDSCYFEITGTLRKPGILRSAIFVTSDPPANASSTCRDLWPEFSAYRVLLNDGINYNLHLEEFIDVPGPYYFVTNPEEFNRQGSYLFRIVN